MKEPATVIGQTGEWIVVERENGEIEIATVINRKSEKHSAMNWLEQTLASRDGWN